MEMRFVNPHLVCGGFEENNRIEEAESIDRRSSSVVDTDMQTMAGMRGY